MKKKNDWLEIDVRSEIERISDFIRLQVSSHKKEGVVVGLSGGIDSAVIAELSVRALGKDRVLGIILPEKESNPISSRYGRKHAEKMGIDHKIIDITPILESYDVYGKRDKVVSTLFKEYNPEYDRIKISLPADILHKVGLNVFTLDIERNGRQIFSKRLKKWEMKKIVAATAIKQRTRMTYLYYHAESTNRLVAGTTNRPELVQGFFVKYGDGGVDTEPIAHLYKTQVYHIGRELGVIKEIYDRDPSPDTYNSFVTDEDFFFRMPYSSLDKLLYAWENGLSIKETCASLSLNEDQVERVFQDFRSKYDSTRHLRALPPSLIKEQ